MVLRSLGVLVSVSLTHERNKYWVVRKVMIYFSMSSMQMLKKYRKIPLASSLTVLLGFTQLFECINNWKVKLNQDCFSLSSIGGRALLYNPGTHGRNMFRSWTALTTPAHTHELHWLVGWRGITM